MFEALPHRHNPGSAPVTKRAREFRGLTLLELARHGLDRRGIATRGLAKMDQEGWDDPACYLAYIVKGMGSSIQVEQIIWRVLRQYDAKHHDAPSLNSEHFFLRLDDESV